MYYTEIQVFMMINEVVMDTLPSFLNCTSKIQLQPKGAKLKVHTFKPSVFSLAFVIVVFML